MTIRGDIKTLARNLAKKPELPPPNDFGKINQSREKKSTIIIEVVNDESTMIVPFTLVKIIDDTSTWDVPLACYPESGDSTEQTLYGVTVDYIAPGGLGHVQVSGIVPILCNKSVEHMILIGERMYAMKGDSKGKVCNLSSASADMITGAIIGRSVQSEMDDSLYVLVNLSAPGGGSGATLVKAASTASLDLTGVETIDGLSCVAGDIVLAKDQSTPSQNGVYIVAVGAWTKVGQPEVVACTGAGTASPAATQYILTAANTYTKTPSGSTGGGATLVKAASTVTLDLNGAETIDGVSCGVGDKVLVKNQNTASQNGTYTVAVGAWVKIGQPEQVNVKSGGTANGLKIFILDSTNTYKAIYAVLK